MKIQKLFIACLFSLTQFCVGSLFTVTASRATGQACIISPADVLDYAQAIDSLSGARVSGVLNTIARRLLPNNPRSGELLSDAIFNYFQRGMRQQELTRIETIVREAQQATERERNLARLRAQGLAVEPRRAGNPPAPQSANRPSRPPSAGTAENGAESGSDYFALGPEHQQHQEPYEPPGAADPIGYEPHPIEHQPPQDPHAVHPGQPHEPYFDPNPHGGQQGHSLHDLNNAAAFMLLIDEFNQIP